MKVQLVKCSDIGLWYYDRKFPIIVTDAEESSIDVNSDSYNTFFSKYNPEDFYYSNQLHGFIAKSDCVNDEEYIKPSVNYEFKARPLDSKFKPSYGTKSNLDPIFSFKEVKSNEYPKPHICEEYKMKKLDIIQETVKFDQGKPDFTLIPQEAELEVAKVFTYGADKYGIFNYSHGTNYRRYIAAAKRHINQWLRGEDIDESGTNHLSNAIASLMMVLDNQLTGKGTDDRNKVYKREV